MSNGITNQTDVPSVSFDEFTFAMKIMKAAASLEMAVENPELKSITTCDEETGEEIVVTLRDHPLTRAISALCQHFDCDKSFAIAFRWFALLRLVGHAGAKEWVKQTDDGVKVHGALVRAAAKVRLKGDGRNFKLREIVRLAREYGEEG